MARGRELSPQLRSRICELRDAGFSYAKIRQMHPEIPLGTIKTTIRRSTERINQVSKPRSGAGRKLSEQERDHLYDTAVHINPHISISDLCSEVDDKVKRRSIQGLMNEMGRRKWIQRVRPEIKPHHAAQRLAWALRHENHTVEDWKKVKWSDECTVERGAGIASKWTYLRPAEQLIQRDIKERRCGKSVKKMLWAAFGHDCRTGLLPLDGDPEAPRGGVSARIIREVYQAFLPTILEPGDTFMHDNASVHTARIISDLLREMGVNVMDWPPYSPDLNPIENLWAVMKKEIYRLRPELEFADDTVDTLHLLIETAKEAWNSIDDHILYNLAISMPNRVAAIIQADGWYTKY